MKTVTVTLRIRRTSKWQDYELQLPADAYVLDALQAAGSQDQSLLFRHACHHASCGSCGVRINGRESLACITPLPKFGKSKPVIRLEPLRNFPLIGDLLVDFRPFMNQLALVDLPYTRNVMDSPGEDQRIERLQPVAAEADLPEMSPEFNRLENCIECGLCVSACPIAGSDDSYAGPAFLAAAARIAAEPRGRSLPEILTQVDHDHGLWRCHAAFECSRVCPAGVDPAREIMSLRSRLLQMLPTSRAEAGIK